MTREELAPILFDAYQRTPDQCFLAMADAALEAMKPLLTPATDDDTSSDHVVLALIAAMERNYSAQTSAGDRERNVWTQALIETAAASQLDSILDRIRFAADLADYVLSSYDSKWGAK